MTVVVEKTQTTIPVDDAAPNELARWHIRAAAFAVDMLPGAAVAATMGLAWLAVPLRSVWWWLSLSVFAAAIVLTGINRVVLPTISGASLGRRLVGISVMRPDGTAPGTGRLLLRELAHLLDTISVFVGWLWPLWDPRRRTFADLLLNTEVRQEQPDHGPASIRRLAAIVVATAALLCVGGAGMSVIAALLPDQQADHTRAEVQAQGPKIVTQMLTYDPKSLQKDFARAQSLTTDKYRPQLLAQQQRVQKGQLVVNEYWPTDSAVLSARPDRATLLVFMQGHRGGGNEQRFITATVRVSFVKGGDARWLVDDLSVITKPKPVKGQK